MEYINIIKIAIELLKLLPNPIKSFKNFHENPSQILIFLGKLIEIALNVTGESNVNKIANQLKEDPKLLMEFKILAMKTKKDIFDIACKDRQNARERDIMLHCNGRKHTKSYIMFFVAAIGVITCPLSIIWCILEYQSVPGEVVAIISTATTIFGACLRDYYSFEFGESSDSIFRKSSNKLNIIKKKIQKYLIR